MPQAASTYALSMSYRSKYCHAQPQPQFFNRMEDDLIFFYKVEDDLNFLTKWKTSSVLFKKLKMTSIFNKMEDDLNFF